MTILNNNRYEFFKKNPFVILGLLTLFVVGLPAAIFLSQNRAENSTHAAGTCAPTIGDLAIDNCHLVGNVGGNLTGSNNTITGNVGGFLIGNSNSISVNTGKSVIGSNNTIGNNVNGCVKGDNNHISNNVYGAIEGTGNTARQVYGLPCPPEPTQTPIPTVELTNTPTTEPTVVPSTPVEPPTSQPTVQPSATPTTHPTSTPTRCNDKIDNDNNGLIDDKDATCHTDGNADNPNSYDPNLDGEHSNTCYDLKDNNGNQLIDIKDPICHTDKDPNNPDSYDPKLPENGNTCADGIDNNGNQLIDIKDPICHTDGNVNNPNSYNPNLPERNGNTCADGKDNNGNNLIDGLDPICHDKINCTGGNIQGATPTPVTCMEGPYNPDLPENSVVGTNLSLSILLHGIGASGDNATTLNSLSNKNPLRLTRTTDVLIYDINNQLVASASGTIKYASASGNFIGSVKTQNTLAPGKYNIRVGLSEHLIRRIPGIQTINADIDNPLPEISLIAGDTIYDNVLNVLDYNKILDCYSDNLPAPACNEANKKTETDTNDDGVINGYDYNLFVREISVQNGD